MLLLPDYFTTRKVGKVSMRSILVTSAGSGVGQAIYEAMQYSAHDYRLIVLNSHGMTPIFDRAHAAYLSPKTSQKEAFMDCLRRVTTTETYSCGP